MLSLHIIVVGKDKEKWVSDQIDHYRKLISRYARLDITVVAEEKYAKSTDIAKAKAKEATAICNRLKGGFVIALEVTGKSLDTKEFSAKLSQLQVQGTSRIEFVIGGPYGLGEEVLRRASLKLSLSALTMSHQIVRLVLLEQLYRVLNLTAGGSYHK